MTYAHQESPCSSVVRASDRCMEGCGLTQIFSMSHVRNMLNIPSFLIMCIVANFSYLSCFPPPNSYPTSYPLFHTTCTLPIHSFSRLLPPECPLYKGWGLEHFPVCLDEVHHLNKPRAYNLLACEQVPSGGGGDWGRLTCPCACSTHTKIIKIIMVCVLIQVDCMVSVQSFWKTTVQHTGSQGTN